MQHNGRPMRRAIREKATCGKEWRYNAPRPGRDVLAHRDQSKYDAAIAKAWKKLQAKYGVAV